MTLREVQPGVYYETPEGIAVVKWFEEFLGLTLVVFQVEKGYMFSTDDVSTWREANTINN